MPGKPLSIVQTTTLASDALAKFAKLHNDADPSDLRRALEFLRQANPELFQWMATLFSPEVITDAR